MHSALTHSDLVQVKDAPPYPKDLKDAVLQNLKARAGPTLSGTWTFKAPLAAFPALAERKKVVKLTTANEQEEGIAKQMVGVQAVGVDIQDIGGLPADNETFIERNFTPANIAYCPAQVDVRAFFCGRFVP